MLFGKKKKIPEYTFYQQTDTKIVEEKQSYKTNISDQAMDELNQLIGLIFQAVLFFLVEFLLLHHI